MNVVSHRNFRSAPPPTYDMMALSRMLGIEKESATSRRDASPKTRIAYVQMLIDAARFPPPIPHMGRDEAGAPRLDHAIHYRKSRWLRGPVDAWFDGIVPPQLAEAIDNAEARAAGARLDQNAAALSA